MSNSPSLTPFEASRYFRDAAPRAARHGVRGYLLRLLLDMARLRGSERGTCFPAVSYLAAQVGRSVRHVRRLLRELETLGEIERIARRRNDGGQSSNVYRLRGLIEWAAKNVRGASDKRVRHNPKGKIHNPARGVKSGFFNSGNRPQTRPTAPVALADRTEAEKGLGPVLSDPVRSAPKWRLLTADQVEEARKRCDPVLWNRHRLAAGLDGVSSTDLDAVAAHRWRADAIIAGVL